MSGPLRPPSLPPTDRVLNGDYHRPRREIRIGPSLPPEPAGALRDDTAGEEEMEAPSVSMLYISVLFDDDLFGSDGSRLTIHIIHILGLLRCLNAIFHICT